MINLKLGICLCHQSDLESPVSSHGAVTTPLSTLTEEEPQHNEVSASTPLLSLQNTAVQRNEIRLAALPGCSN